MLAEELVMLLVVQDISLVEEVAVLEMVLPMMEVQEEMGAEATVGIQTILEHNWMQRITPAAVVVEEMVIVPIILEVMVVMEL